MPPVWEPPTPPRFRCDTTRPHHIHPVQVLLKSDARTGHVDLNAQCSKQLGFTALHFSVSQSHAAVVTTLVAGLASPLVRDSKGRAPLQLAIALRDARPDMCAHHTTLRGLTHHLSTQRRTSADCGSADQCQRKPYWLRRS